LILKVAVRGDKDIEAGCFGSVQEFTVPESVPAVGRWIQAEIFGVPSVPLATLAGAAALLAAAMLLASILPAQRAARMDPKVVLRE
jgi:hypothetical protein